METLRKYEHFFGVLAVAKPELRKAMLFKSDDALIKAIVEIVLNTLNGNLPISKKVIRQMKPHRVIMRKIANKKKRQLKSHRRILVQKGGGFIPYVCKAYLDGLRRNDSGEQGRVLCPETTHDEPRDIASGSSDAAP